MIRPQSQVLSQSEVEQVRSIISQRDGVQYKFFRFLNLHKLSLVFVSDSDQQQVLTCDHCKTILNHKE